MKAKTLYAVGGIMSAAVLASGGVATALATENAAQPHQPAQEATLEGPSAATVEKRVVEGLFSYDQNVVTANERIASVFRAATTAVCASLPDYNLHSQHAQTIAVGGSAADASFTATVDEMASADDSQTYVMACACASNTAGGGAIVNAQVEGVSLESVMELAGVTAP